MHLRNSDIGLEFFARLDCVTEIEGSPHGLEVSDRLENGDLPCWIEIEARVTAVGYTVPRFLGGIVLAADPEQHQDEIVSAIRSHKLVEEAYQTMQRVISSHGIEIDLGGFPPAPTDLEIKIQWE